MRNVQISTKSALGLLTLLGLRGIGPQAVERLRSRFDTLDAIRAASPRELELVSPAARASLADAAAWETSFDKAESTHEQASRCGVRVLAVDDDEYPVLLRSIPERPLVLYVKGKLARSSRSVACIGTREPSVFGAEVTKRIVSVLADQGWSIVSGLAIGVDALSHATAVERGAHTVAVLANGLDTIYPRKNAKLAEQILETGGALVSEQPFGTPAIGRNLVQRDRLQSGMSLGTIVMQTDIVGGSMHTVRFTTLQRRLLFAPVPRGRHAEEPKSQGILALTQEPGRALRKRVKAEGEYGVLLDAEFATRPLAVPLESRADYDRLLGMLERAGQQEVPSATRAQLGMF